MTTNQPGAFLGKHTSTIWIAIVLYVALTAFFGYRFGDEDMTETLSYALYLHDTSLFPHDLYIQAVGSSWLNERLPFTMIFYPFVSHLEWASFFLHLISSFLFLFGLIRIARKYLENDLFVFGYCLIVLFALYNLNLGGNEAWYHYFVPSQAAKSIGIWSLVFFLERKWTKAYLVLVPVTLMQPVVGIQLALLITCVTGWQALNQRSFQKIPFTGLGIYMITAGVWLIAVFTHHLISDSSITSKEFYDIMESRLAHHFFPSYYPFKSWLILIPLFVFGALGWKKISSDMFQFFLFSFLGMVIYLLLIEILELPYFLSAQWFKTTVWLKPLSVLAIFHWLERLRPSQHLGMTFKITTLLLLVVSIAQLTGLLTIVHGKPYHFPNTNYHNAQMEIALEAKDQLDPDACILIPPTVTGIRYFSQRSLYIDYKSNIHSKKYMKESYDRRKALYGMTLDMRRSGGDMVMEGNKYYHQLSQEDLEDFKQDGATHVLVENNRILDLPKVVTNSLFTLYKL